MPYNNNSKNAMLNQLATLAVFVSAHTADPSTTGANEVTGGAYARKAVTWGAAAAGAMAASNAPVIDIPVTTTVTHVGLWSASSGGTFYGGIDITDEAYTGAGTLTLTSISLNLNN